jgi:hypothetical protein
LKSGTSSKAKFQQPLWLKNQLADRHSAHGSSSWPSKIMHWMYQDQFGWLASNWLGVLSAGGLDHLDSYAECLPPSSVITARLSGAVCACLKGWSTLPFKPVYYNHPCIRTTQLGPISFKD